MERNKRNEFIIELIEQAKKRSIENSNNNFPPMDEEEREKTLRYLEKLERKGIER